MNGRTEKKKRTPTFHANEEFLSLLLSDEENGFETSGLLFHFAFHPLPTNSLTFLLLLSNSFVPSVGTLAESTSASSGPPSFTFNLREPRTGNLPLQILYQQGVHSTRDAMRDSMILNAIRIVPRQRISSIKYLES